MKTQGIKRNKKSFKLTILQAFITILVLTVGLLSGIFYIGSKNAIILLSDRITREVSDKVILSTTHYLNGPAQQTITVSNLATSTLVTSTLVTSTLVTSTLVTDPGIMSIHEELWKYMWEQQLVYTQMQSFFIADTNGSYVQVRREPRLATRYIDNSKDKQSEKIIYRDENYKIIETEEKTSTFDPRTRSWYKNTGTERKIYWTDVYVSTTAQTPVISASSPVLDDEGNLDGVVCTNIPLHSISDFIREHNVSKNGIVFIANEKNEVIAYPGIGSTIKVDETTKESRLIFVDELEEKSVTRAYDLYRQSHRNKYNSPANGINYMVNVISFPKSFSSEWKIFVVIPESDILGSVNNMLFAALFAAIVILFFSIFFIFIITNNIGKSIINLATSTDAIKDFRLDEFEGVPSKIKEINLMSDALLKTTEGLKSFRKYVPAELVRKLIQMNENAELGGERKELTIFFTDIQSFTTLSQDMAPEKVMNHLSDYLDNLCSIIMRKKGTIDKFIGDGIMAFWGAPVTLPDHPELACEAALACQKRLKELNIIWEEKKLPPLHTRIGIHTGNTVVGNVGSSERMNYTIVGDNVNLASRLEGTNKIYGTKVLISEDTYERVADKFLVRPLDIVAVKGRSKSVRIYELVSPLNEPVPGETKDFCMYFEEAFNLYLKKEWKKAHEIFKKLSGKFPHDKSLILYMKRCEDFFAHPELIPGEWDGTIVLTSK
ncbi:MAG: hypothetical protein JXJ04_19370 [Spirochaetales bacterium]|nr:hypothetical protein [Spirochaetales bacterium]